MPRGRRRRLAADTARIWHGAEAAAGGSSGARNAEVDMRRVMLLATSLCLLTIAPASAAEDMTVHISPKVTRRPGALLVRVKVEPHEENRALVVETDSEDYFRSSEYQVEG